MPVSRQNNSNKKYIHFKLKKHFFWWYWGLDSGLGGPEEGCLPLEPFHQLSKIFNFILKKVKKDKEMPVAVGDTPGASV
jgi:hypothetical protein